MLYFNILLMTARNILILQMMMIYVLRQLPRKNYAYMTL